MLNEFQLAVLTEMGLTVFVSSDNCSVNDALSTVSTTSNLSSNNNSLTGNQSESASNKISALRETLDSSSNEKADSVKLNTSQSSSTTKPQPLDIKNKALIGDIHVALASLNLPTPDVKNWLVSDSNELTLNDQFIALPFNGKALSAQDKKHLWRQLLQVQVSLSP